MTEDDIESYKLQTPYPSLFANGGVMNSVDSDASGYTYSAGIPTMYSSRTGKKVDRADINGIGRLITQSRWFGQLGGYYTFDQNVSNAIGGYPEGAILYYKEYTSGYIRPVRSLIPDNDYDFVNNPEYINNEYWSYVDTFLPKSVRPRVFLNGMQSGSVTSGVNSVVVDTDSLLIIQTGIQGKDSTEGRDSSSYFLEVRRAGEESFYTAAMVGFLPSLRTCWTQGDASYAIEPQIEGLSKSAYTAFYSSSPIQVYLKAGDEFRVVCSSNETAPISLHYQCFSLSA